MTSLFAFPSLLINSPNAPVVGSRQRSQRIAEREQRKAKEPRKDLKTRNIVKRTANLIQKRRNNQTKRIANRRQEEFMKARLLNHLELISNVQLKKNKDWYKNIYRTNPKSIKSPKKIDLFQELLKLWNADGIQSKAILKSIISTLSIPQLQLLSKDKLKKVNNAFRINNDSQNNYGIHLDFSKTDDYTNFMFLMWLDMCHDKTILAKNGTERLATRNRKPQVSFSSFQSFNQSPVVLKFLFNNEIVENPYELNLNTDYIKFILKMYTGTGPFLYTHEVNHRIYEDIGLSLKSTNKSNWESVIKTKTSENAHRGRTQHIDHGNTFKIKSTKPKKIENNINSDLLRQLTYNNKRIDLCIDMQSESNPLTSLIQDGYADKRIFLANLFDNGVYKMFSKHSVFSNATTLQYNQHGIFEKYAYTLGDLNVNFTFPNGNNNKSLKRISLKKNNSNSNIKCHFNYVRMNSNEWRHESVKRKNAILNNNGNEKKIIKFCGDFLLSCNVLASNINDPTNLTAFGSGDGMATVMYSFLSKRLNEQMKNGNMNENGNENGNMNGNMNENGNIRNAIKHPLIIDLSKNGKIKFNLELDTAGKLTADLKGIANALVNMRQGSGPSTAAAATSMNRNRQPIRMTQLLQVAHNRMPNS